LDSRRAGKALREEFAAPDRTQPSCEFSEGNSAPNDDRPAFRFQDRAIRSARTQRTNPIHYEENSSFGIIPLCDSAADPRSWALSRRETIVAVASNAGQFKTLVTAMKAAGLVEL
jgi:uncharacterized surface protein with fasciclin (FAS1) repeats